METIGMKRIILQAVWGTWAWAAPEVLLGRRSTTQADIYSFGVMMWELITGESPVRGGARDVLVPVECPLVIYLAYLFLPNAPPPPTPLSPQHHAPQEVGGFVEGFGVRAAVSATSNYVLMNK